MVNTPCSLDCCLEDGVCVSCKRTVEDIVEWSNMTEEEREDRIEELGH
jgi:predicted Fe-S protein YdhL (DUF1289 family)